MVLLIDTNIILDVLAKREPFFEDSSTIWKLCETKQVTGIVSALTIANLVYILRKELDPNKTEDVLKVLKLIFRFTELGQSDILNAAGLKWEDFEDAVQYVTAVRTAADCIVTRNKGDFLGSSIPTLKPDEFLIQFKNISEKTGN